MPRLVNVVGSVRDVIPQQPSNAPESIVVNAFERIREARALQLWNANGPILVTESGSEREVSLLHDWKAK